jgi:hypothetical protein
MEKDAKREESVAKNGFIELGEGRWNLNVIYGTTLSFTGLA